MIRLPALPFAPVCTLVFFMVLSAFAAVWATPKMEKGVTAPVLEDIIPSAFGDWHQVEADTKQVSLSTDGERSQDQPYDQVISRTYENGAGQKVMLSLAYAQEQKQDVKIHRPEVCYVAQGYTLLSKQEQHIHLSPDIPEAVGKRLLTKREGRLETVSYWVRVGNDYPRGGLDARWVIFKDGMQGKVDDGILVRASMIVSEMSNVESAFTMQERFMSQLARTVALNQPGVLTPVSSLSNTRTP